TISPMHVVVASHQQLPAKGYGGPQRVVVALVRGLAAHGHRVTLLAPPGTRVPEAKLVEVPPRKFNDPTSLAPYLPRDGDILHVHFPLKRGLDPAEYFFRRFPKRPEQYDLFLGKLHSAKGYHWAVEAAKRTGHPLIVAGGWRPSFTGSIKYVGEVDGATKAALLARARCLWNPAEWDEPFGLVTVEAFLSGTPVLGTRRGALPELITAEAGALCDTMDEMIAAPETTVIHVPPQQLTNPNIDLGSLVPRDADMLHIFFPVMRAPSRPFVQTLEGNLRAGAAVPPNNIFVSRDHARRSGSDVFVYNGLDPTDFLFRSVKDDYHLFLGRLHSAKGYRWAI